MTAALHPYSADEMAAGQALADAFLQRVTSREPIEADALAQQAAIARLGAPERLRGFHARIQRALVEGACDAG